MSATNSSAAVARSQAKRRRSALDSLKRVLPERSAKLTAGLTIVIAMVLFAIIVPIFTKDPNKINDIGLSAPSAQHWLGTTQSGQACPVPSSSSALSPTPTPASIPSPDSITSTEISPSIPSTLSSALP